MLSLVDLVKKCSIIKIASFRARHTTIWCSFYFISSSLLALVAVSHVFFPAFALSSMSAAAVQPKNTYTAFGESDSSAAFLEATYRLFSTFSNEAEYKECVSFVPDPNAQQVIAGDRFLHLPPHPHLPLSTAPTVESHLKT